MIRRKIGAPISEPFAAILHDHHNGDIQQTGILCLGIAGKPGMRGQSAASTLAVPVLPTTGIVRPKNF